MELPRPGVLAAVLTPFGADGEVDRPALRAHLEWLLAAGIDGVLPAGTTGEGALLDEDEVMVVVEDSLAVAEGRAAVVAHVGRPCGSPAAPPRRGRTRSPRSRPTSTHRARTACAVTTPRSARRRASCPCSPTRSPRTRTWTSRRGRSPSSPRTASPASRTPRAIPTCTPPTSPPRRGSRSTPVPPASCAPRGAAARRGRSWPRANLHPRLSLAALAEEGDRAQGELDAAVAALGPPATVIGALKRALAERLRAEGIDYPTATRML